MPLPPDPWFTETPSFDKSTLPPGVEIQETNNLFRRHELINKNSEPLFIVRKKDPRELSSNNAQADPFLNSGLPKDYEPLYKITKDQVYFWDKLSNPNLGEWKMDDGSANDSGYPGAPIDGNYNLYEASRQIEEDNRPIFVKIPDPQEFYILGFYKGNPIEIKGTISYSLNSNYNPQKNEKSGCGEVWQGYTFRKIIGFSVFLTVTLVVIVGIGFLIYKLIRKYLQ